MSKRRVESELCACVDPIPVCEAERSCAAAGEGRSGFRNIALRGTPVAGASVCETERAHTALYT